MRHGSGMQCNVRDGASSLADFHRYHQLNNYHDWYSRIESWGESTDRAFRWASEREKETREKLGFLPVLVHWVRRFRKEHRTERRLCVSARLAYGTAKERQRPAEKMTANDRTPLRVTLLSANAAVAASATAVRCSPTVVPPRVQGGKRQAEAQAGHREGQWRLAVVVTTAAAVKPTVWMDRTTVTVCFC